MSLTQTITLDYGQGTITTTPFQLLQWKHALKLESKGLTMSRGRKVSTHLKQLMGLKRTTKPEYLLEWVESVIATVMGEDDERQADVGQDVVPTG